MRGSIWSICLPQKSEVDSGISIAYTATGGRLTEIAPLSGLAPSQSAADRYGACKRQLTTLKIVPWVRIRLFLSLLIVLHLTMLRLWLIK